MNDILHNNLTNAIYFEGDNPDEKRYLLLLTLYPDSTDDISDSYRDWSIKIGRQATYDYLKHMIKEELIDPNLSFIIAGKAIEDNSSKDKFIPESSPITVFRFMKVMLVSNKVLDDRENFCIDEYASDTNGDPSILEV